MISWVAMDRIVERKRAADADYREQAAGKVLRSDAKRLTDGELLAKLSSFGIELDRPSLERLCDQALSAEEIAQPLLDQRTFHGQTRADGKRLDLDLPVGSILSSSVSKEGLSGNQRCHSRPAMNCGHPAP
jgi:hypothetical protein